MFVVNKKILKDFLKRLLIALFTLLIASLIRKYLLGSLENKVVWITYYPAVMVSALFGGFFIGIFSAILTCLIALFGWQYFTNNPFINNSADWISLYVFLFNCSLVSLIAEYSRYQRRKADQSKEQAELANKTKSIFLANMSHELRTPLNAILGFTNLMRQNESIPEVEKKNLEIVNRSGEHLLNLINNVLDISKIEAGKIEVNKSEFNLRNCINDIILIMTQRAEAKGLRFEALISEEISDVILSDELKIKQILINLLGNAIKFTSQGSISLSFQVDINQNDKLIIEIKDSGIGILEKDLKKIFDPFIQVGNKDLNIGTGLGLTITKQFVELLDGKISVSSQIGKGTTFKVILPYIKVNNANLNKENYRLIKSIVSSEKVHKILIVEDQYENWTLLQRILESVGLKSEVAVNGLEGVELFKSIIPDLIFMDLRMPVMDGLEATKEIRLLENGKKVKIIGVSAHVFKEDMDWILNSGMDDFIKKPYSFDDIFTSLKKHLGIKFIYQDSDKSTINKIKSLQIEMFNNIDKSLVRELKLNIQNLEFNNLINIIDNIKVQNKELGDILFEYISNYKMTAVFNILKGISDE